MATTFKASVTIDGSPGNGVMAITIQKIPGDGGGSPEPPDPPVEHQWRPPDWLRMDSELEEVPDIPPPGYLEVWDDPVFASRVTRITGNPGDPVPGIPGATWGTVCRHHYSSDQAWNCDQSMLYLDSNNGSGASALMLDGETYTPLFAVSGIPGDVRWTREDPNLMWYVADSEIGLWNPANETRETVMDFGPAYTDLTFGGYEGSFSKDGNRVVVMCMYEGQSTGFVYDVGTGAKGPNIWASEVAAGTCDNIRVSAGGSYILWGFDPDVVYITDLEGALVTTLPEDFISHFDVIVDENGDDCVCGRINGDVGHSASGRVAKYRLRDGAFTELTPGGWSYHTSCRSMSRWAVAGTGQENGSYPPYNAEIIMAALDGSKVYRLCHSHVANSFSYDEETQPSHSPDGGRVVFASAWSGSVGDYVVDFRE